MPTKPEIDAFMAIARCGSLSAAAAQLYVTQPALSRRIASLEDELGCRLFERGKGMRGVTLTAQGKAFLGVARKWDAVWRETQSIRSIEHKPLLRVAAIGTVSTFLLPGVLRDLTVDDAPCRVDYHLCHSSEGYSLVEEDLADVALIDFVYGAAGYSTSSVEVRPAYSVPFAVLGGPAWAGRDVVSVADLDLRREVYLPWDSAYEAWRTQRLGTGVAPFASLDNATMLAHVLRDDLFAFVPRSSAAILARQADGLAVADLLDGPPDETVCCLVGAGMAGNPKISGFLGLVKAHLLATPGVQCLLP